jgi:hypothetical protein
MENLLKNETSFFNWNLAVPAEFLCGILLFEPGRFDALPVIEDPS